MVGVAEVGTWVGVATWAAMWVAEEMVVVIQLEGQGGPVKATMPSEVVGGGRSAEMGLNG